MVPGSDTTVDHEMHPLAGCRGVKRLPGDTLGGWQAVYGIRGWQGYTWHQVALRDS